MDPLSVIANLVAVAGAAANVSQKLRKLTSLRGVPEQILLLANEVSDFRCVLVTVTETVRQLRNTSPAKENLELEESIQQLVERAATHLNEVDDILNSGLIRNLDSINVERAKISWGKWLKKHGHLQRLSTTLRDIRRDLSVTLTVVMASETPRVRAHLESITFLADETRTSAAKALGDFDMQLESVRRQVASTQSEIDTTFRRLQAAQHPSHATNELSDETPQSQRSMFRVRTALRKSCNSSCRCQCHKRTSLSSPKWMKDIIGLMFIDYSGKPILGSQICNEKLCHQQEKSLLRINYYFPVWFLRRIIIFRDYSKSLLAGERMISVRTPRIVDAHSDQIVMAQSGSLSAMQALFSQHLASPFDSNPTGESLLHIAVSWKRPDMCRLLLASQIDNESRTPIDIVWDLILQGPQDPVNQELKVVFEPFLDPDTDLQSKRFSILHQCVLGLNHLNLEDYLLLTTSEIESHCSMGRPPLFWAASSSNLPAVSTLLKFGASIDFVDEKGQNVIHRAILASNVEVLETILRTASMMEPVPCNHITSKRLDTLEKDEEPSPCTECSPDSFVRNLINHEDNWGWPPLSFAAEFKRPAHAKVLLDYGAATQNALRAPPLLVAIQTGSIDVLEILLKRGARTDVMDSYSQQNVLHYAAQTGCTKVFQLLGDYNNCCVSTCDKDSEGVTPLQSFDTERARYIHEDDRTFLESREAFVRLLKRIEQWNLDHSDPKNDKSALHTVPEVSNAESLHSDDDGDDEFFDAKSTFEVS